MPFAFRLLLISRFYSTSTKQLPEPLSKIPWKFRLKAIHDAQKALTDYLHTTRSLPFTYAENIAKNSIVSLSDLVSKVPYTPLTFLKSFQKYLRYNPVNEFEFFYESIGIRYEHIRPLLPADKFFFVEVDNTLNVAFVLSKFGFPWSKIGLLCIEDLSLSLFSKDPENLNDRLVSLKDVGFNVSTVIGICLAFPQMLFAKGESDCEVNALFNDLKCVFLDYNVMNCVEENVDAFYDVCLKIRAFYDMGCEKGKVGEILGRGKSILFDYSEELLLKKIDFFVRFGVHKKKVGWLILRCPEILSYDLETKAVSLLGFLEHFGMSSSELMSVATTYPYLLGKTRILNLPNAIRALDHHEWFFDKMTSGNHHLLANYMINDPKESVDVEYEVGLKRILSGKYPVHTMLKLDFMHRIGFGENEWTLRVLQRLHGTSSELQDRFDCLLNTGIDYSKLCRIISLSPNILDHKPEKIRKLNCFLCEEMGGTFQHLDVFPALLSYDLESRVMPRLRFHIWLTQKGLCKTDYFVATSEQKFIARLSAIHPAAPKHWFECFSCKQSRSSHLEK